MLADGTTFEGEADRRRLRRRRRHRRGRVQHRASAATRRSSPTRPTPGRSSPSPTPTSATTARTPADDEAARPFCRGVIVRDLARRRSNWRSDADLDAFLRRNGVPGIAGIDTRRLTRHLRDAGAMPGAFGTADETSLKQAAARRAGHRRHRPGAGGHHAPSPTPWARAPPGGRLRLRHQDGDPPPPRRDRHRRGRPGVDARRRRAGPRARRRVPVERPRRPGRGRLRHRRHRRAPRRGAVFGICLGHQLLVTALGGTTYKLPFGHHGGNHPVRRLATGSVEITSQNHNYAVADDSLRGVAEVTHATSTTA